MALCYCDACRGVVGVPSRVAGDRMGIAGARSGAEHQGLVGVGGSRHPGEKGSH